MIQSLSGPGRAFDGAFRGLWALEPHCSFVNLKKRNESQQQHFILLQSITQSLEIWVRHGARLNCEFLDACVTQEALFPLNALACPTSAWSPQCMSVTLPALTNAGAKTTTNYIKKATEVTADSMMVSCSTLNPVFWGFILCARLCCCMLCGFACLDFVSSVFRCFGQSLGSEKWEVFYSACLKSNYAAQG